MNAPVPIVAAWTEFETLQYREAYKVAWITLNRPEVMNAFNVTLQMELHSCWREQKNDDVNVVVLTGAGDRAFCTGVGRKEAYSSEQYESTAAAGRPGDSPFMFNSVAPRLGPRSN